VARLRRPTVARVIRKAETEATRWFSSMEPWRPPGPRRFYPARTLRTLHLAATTRFQAGAVLLRRPLLAAAVSDQVRALIELFAHGAWITAAGGISRPMTPRARAICVELGMSTALVSELEFLETELGIQFSNGYIDDKRWLVRHFARLHANHGCSCHGAGRGYRSVQQTLRELEAVKTAERLRSIKLIYGLWKTSSRAVHFPRLEHIADDAPGGAALKPASARDRAISLYNLVLIQSYIAGFAATGLPAVKRHIGFSAWFLLDEIAALTH
jgi:hypothetical protein